MKISAQELRNIISEIIQPTIEIRRASLGDEFLIDHYGTSDLGTEPTDEEITDFILSNPLYNTELMEQLFDPGLLGFSSRIAEANENWVEEFRNNSRGWSINNSWLAGDAPFLLYNDGNILIPDNSELWTPSDGILPGWTTSAPAVLLAIDYLRSGKPLHSMHWRKFEELISQLLEENGWTVELTPMSGDGGIDVVASRIAPDIGLIKSVWQAKKYKPSNHIQLSTIRELITASNDYQASKAMLVTTSYLAEGAIERIRQDEYRLGYKEQKELESWIYDTAEGK